jgi:asparagine synthase (glutamine-hydrolysing)
MCGIAGYLNRSSSQKVEENLLDRMQQVIAHRGPDDYGVWLSQDHQVGFSHRRLSILDLSTAGKQPMMDRDKTIIVSYNGEIYNHLELREELESLGYRYISNTDTETIIHAYREWGIECIHKFEGMFAIALFDSLKNELYLVRDRMGIKPLYFSLLGDAVSFASEIKSLWELPWIDKELNVQGLYHYLTYLVTPAPMTLYKGVYKLPAGFYIKVDAAKNVTFNEWYSPLIPQTTYSQKELNDEQFCIDRIRTLLRSSIKQQMISDVPYGVFLSGGIDSSLNVALMSEFTDRVKTFNVSFSDGPEYSEVMWARKVAQQFNTDHHELVISEKEAFEFFNSMVHHQDEPLADCVCVPLYYVAKLLKDAGVTVVQVGEGSDELFCGYSSYAQYLDVHRKYWGPSQRFIPAFARKGMHATAAYLFPQKKNRLDIIKNWADGKNLFWSGATAFSEVWKQDLWRSKELYESDSVVEQIYGGIQQDFNSYSFVEYHLKQLKVHEPQADFLKSMIYLELKQRLPELLLMRVDKMAMATSVEGRVPFLDHNLVEFALQIPTKLKYKDGITKYILKKACEGILPHDVIYRKKVGFAAPTSRWFKKGAYFKPYFQDLLEKKRQSAGAHLNIDGINKLFEQNLEANQELSMQLWVLQNVLATDVL